VDESGDIKNRLGEWEKGKKVEIQKKPIEELGYKVDDSSTDLKNRREEWEKGSIKQTTQGGPIKKPVEELGYKVDEASAEDIRKRKDEWEKGKSVPVVPSSVRNPNDVGYKVDAEGVKDRLQKWNTIGSTKSGTPERKQPVKIPTENATKDDQTDVKTVKYGDE